MVHSTHEQPRVLLHSTDHHAPRIPHLIRVYGDSLSLPRASDGIAYDDTYPEIVRRQLAIWAETPIALYNRSYGGATIADLKRVCDYDSTYFGDIDEIVILQLGIVDCAPRPLGPTLRYFVGRLPYRIKHKTIRFLHNNRAKILRAGLGSRFTSPTTFEKLYREWLRTICQRRSVVYILNIAPTLPHIEEHSPGLMASIRLYNATISTLVSEIPANRPILIDVHEAIMSLGAARCIHPDDGHHITSTGHRLYADLILAEERKRLGLSC